MSVKILDHHVKREKICLKAEAQASGDFLQLKDDNSIVSGKMMKNSQATFTELSAPGMETVDGNFSELVALQSGKNHFLMVSKPQSLHAMTLKVKVKKTKYSVIFDEKRFKIPEKKKSYWFLLKRAEGCFVYESLAYRGYYMSVEGQQVQMRKVTGDLTRNFLMNIMSAPQKRYSSHIRSRTVSITAVVMPGTRAVSAVAEVVAVETDVAEKYEVTEDNTFAASSRSSVMYAEVLEVQIESPTEGEDDNDDESSTKGGEDDIDVEPETSRGVGAEAAPLMTSEVASDNTEVVVVKPDVMPEDISEVPEIDKEQSNGTSEASGEKTRSTVDNALNEKPDDGTNSQETDAENTVLNEYINKIMKREVISNTDNKKPIRKGLDRFFNLFSCVS